MASFEGYCRIRSGSWVVHVHSDPELRFWKLVRIFDGTSRPASRQCWSWEGIRNDLGYGRLTVNNRLIMAHRYSYEIHVGPIPEGLEACHTCDNPSCVNPAHIFIGTRSGNQADMVRKNRQAKGERVASAVLTEAQVLQIRQRYNPRSKANGQRALAREFKVGQATIWRVVNGAQWRYLL